MNTSEAVTGLIEAVSTPPDRNDLGRLAQMHTCCQVLMEPDSSASEPVRAVAKALSILLERLILDEAAEPVAGIALIPGVIEAINQLSQGGAADVEGLLGQINTAAGAGGTVSVTSAPAPSAAPPQPVQPVAAPPQAVAPTPEPPAAPPQAAPTPPPAAAPTPAPAPAAPVAQSAPDSGGELYVSEPLFIDMSESEHLQGFLEEATEHMDAIEAGLLEVESDPSDTGKINELFRPFHTIKGIAGFLNLRDINRLTHEIETILDSGRKGQLKITAGTVDLIFNAVDLLKAQLDALRQYMAEPSDGPCRQPEIVEIMAALRRAGKGEVVASAAPKAKVGEILVAEGAVDVVDVAAALAAQQQDGTGQKIGEILVEKGVASRSELDKALAQQASGKPIHDTSIRVDTAKLDILVDAVGELVIAHSMVSMSDIVRNDDKLLRNVSQVTKIVRDVQETAMAMRMLQIGQTFQKMRRLVRDVSRKANKQVELVIGGEETELDKNVIQQISDPLVHMVRNAVDHGIETAEQRRAAGKPETGTVWLNAYHQGDSIVIEIRDDGKGLDPKKLIAKGIERGLIGPSDQLSDAQAFALILQPGFSTAEVVTDISGRGVGMDVVKRNVEQLRGKIEIESQKGHGSTFLIRLPLTLAIIDGMVVKLGEERVIIPTILIEQSLRPERKLITSVQRRGEMLQVRGELCPLIQLGVLFNYTRVLDPCENLVIIVQCEGQKIALVVEELIGQQQVVIKTLGDRFKQVHGISGAAILGDGRVGLILEPSGLLALHKRVGGSMLSDNVVKVASASTDEVVTADLTPAEPVEEPEGVAEGPADNTDEDSTAGVAEPASTPF